MAVVFWVRNLCEMMRYLRRCQESMTSFWPELVISITWTETSFWYELIWHHSDRANMTSFWLELMTYWNDPFTSLCLELMTYCEMMYWHHSLLNTFSHKRLGNQNLTEVQLVGSSLPYEGYIMLDGATFCDPIWSRNDAQVSCIQLGYLGIDTERWNNSYVGNSEDFPPGKLLEKRYNCSGTEGSLKDCPQTVDNKKTCGRQKSVSVTCKYPFPVLWNELALKYISWGLWTAALSNEATGIVSDFHPIEVHFRDDLRLPFWTCSI